MIEKISKIKHNFSKLIPTTIELMFDACLGILLEDFNMKMRDAHNDRNPRLLFLRQQWERDYARDKALVLYLKERVTSIYSEVMSEQKEDKTEEVSCETGGNIIPIGRTPTEGKGGA